MVTSTGWLVNIGMNAALTATHREAIRFCVADCVKLFLNNLAMKQRLVPQLSV